MVRRSFRFVALAGLAIPFATPALATTRSSFTDVDQISGITVTHLAGFSYEVSVDIAPIFEIGSQSYMITDVFGFYALADTADLTPLAMLSSVGSFSNDSSNAGPGGIAGWRSNPNQGLTPGESLVFTFDSLDLANVDRWGFHVRLDGTFPGTSGNTGNITSVPAPAAGAAMLSVGLLAIRRRR
jgi:LPXTG-motif cell wall-anchored protein